MHNQQLLIMIPIETKDEWISGFFGCKLLHKYRIESIPKLNTCVCVHVVCTGKCKLNCCHGEHHYM